MWGYVMKMGGLLVLLGVIGLACSLTAQYFAAKASWARPPACGNDLSAHIGSPVLRRDRQWLGPPR